MKKFTIMMLVATMAVAIGVGCDKGTEAEAPAPSAAEAPAAPTEAPAAEEAPNPLVDKAKELAKLRADIRANPEAVDDLLEKAELTEDSLEQLLFEIAQDPEASAAYAEAR